MITLEQPLKKRFWLYANIVTDGKYVVDEENKEQLRRIFEIIEEGKKGVVVCGKPGSGKTFIFQILQKIYQPAFHSKRIGLRSADSLVAKYDKLGDDGLVIKTHNLCIDELGREKIGKYYGSDLDVLQLIIQRRYQDFKLNGYITHFTSNYSKQDLRNRYGEHCYSRLHEMCEFINLGVADNYQDRRLNAGTFKFGLPELLVPTYEENIQEQYQSVRELAESETIKQILKKL